MDKDHSETSAKKTIQPVEEVKVMTFSPGLQMRNDQSQYYCSLYEYRCSVPCYHGD